MENKDEHWRQIKYKIYAGIYEVSTNGRVRRKDTQKILPGHNHTGYRRVKLSNNKKKRKCIDT